MQNSPESIISYNREKQVFRFHNKSYTIRLVDGVYVIGNEQGVDRFYFKVGAPFMNYPEQVSIYTRKCKLPQVVFYMTRLNRNFFEYIPERWLEIWVIALFKNLCSYFGEEYLISPSVLDKNGQFHASSFISLLRMYTSYMKQYPDSVIANFPYTRNSFEIDFLVSMIGKDGLNMYFEPVDTADMQADLVTTELQLAYAEIYSNTNSVYLHYNLKAIEDVNDAILTRKTYVVFNGSVPIFSFSTEYEKMMLTI